jgi:hypothetical protein
MRVTFNFENRNLLLNADEWDHLISGGNSPALTSVSAAIVGTLRDGGAVMIDKRNVGIMKRMDSVPEFDAYLSDINDIRKLENLDPIKR